MKMETSDSECFESADEEFYSDEDLNTIVSSDNKKDVNKVIETCEKTINSLEKLNINKDVNKNFPSKSLKEPVSEGTDLTDNQKVQLQSNEGLIENDAIEKCAVSKTEQSNKQREAKVTKKTEKIKLGLKINKSEESKINVNIKQETQVEDACNTNEILNNNSKQGAEKLVDTNMSNNKEEINISSQKDSIKIEDTIEENLWDDDEIDWEKESKIEENQKLSNDKDTNMWEDDEWEAIDNVPVESNKNTEQRTALNLENTSNSGWGNWGSWGGVSSILNTATQGVTTLTSHVQQGINTVLETGIGVPDPEELARLNKVEEEKLLEKIKQDERFVEESPASGLGGFGIGNLVSGVSQLTKMVESTGTKVISGGLDTLETIGKKTMEVLQEGDPGLKKKRAFLKLENDKPILSQVLREAKEKAETENKRLAEKHYQQNVKNYETLFDDHQGLVHLEALEMLSKQCDIKLETLCENSSGDALTEMQETLDQVKELCELPEEDEDEQLDLKEIKEKIEASIGEININITYDKLLTMWVDTENWLQNLKLNLVDERELHQQAIETLAQLTAISVEQFHKAGELLLVKDHRSTADEADSLVQLTTALTSLIGIVAAKFTEKLNAKMSNCKNKETINELITAVFFEASNSSSYIQDAFQLLIPVLQVGAV